MLESPNFYRKRSVGVLDAFEGVVRLCDNDFPFKEN